MKHIFVSLLLATSVLGRKGFGPTEQEWGYVTVRPGAHMFWWFHQTLANSTDYTKIPVVIWLQGGPGSSSTEYGNFEELGPLDTNLAERNTTWLKNYNLLFVDNPVGTGFSYVEEGGTFATTNKEIAEDFVVLLQGFYKTMPQLKDTPLYIFCESYGGKMTAEIALEVDRSVKDGNLDVKLLGVGLGDSWISPVDSVTTWGPYLLSVGAIDQNGYEKIQMLASLTKEVIDKGWYNIATRMYSGTALITSLATSDIDFYNILSKVHSGSKKSTSYFLIAKSYSSDNIMNTLVKEALDLDVEWGQQGGEVFDNLFEDFMKPVTDIVELLLNTTDIRVAVYNGQLDLIVDTPGTVKWVNALKFDGALKWKTADRYPIVVDQIVEGYYKKVENLAFYWVNRAGHMVPADNPAAMGFILEDVISGEWEKTV